MSAPHADTIVGGYVSRLEAELKNLPSSRRREIVEDVSQHIREARAELVDETDADLLNVLDRLGDPAEVAAEARDRLGIRPPPTIRAGALEVAALVLLVLIWPVGVILVWVSSAWKTRDKLIATLVPPGGYPGLSILTFMSLGHRGPTCVRTYDENSHLVSSTGCPPPPPGWVLPLEMAIFVLVLVLPILTAIYLGIRLSRARDYLEPGPALSVR